MVWLGGTLAALIIALLALAASADIGYRIIPNWIAATIAVLGLAIRLSVSPSALLVSACIALAVFAGMVFLHSRRVFGGGDVKLVAATCLGLAPAATNQFIFVTAMAGGIVAVLHLIGRRVVRNRGLCAPLPRGTSLFRRIVSIEIWRLARHGSLPYGVAIACGGIWAILAG